MASTKEKSRQNRSGKSATNDSYAIVVFFAAFILQPFNVLAWNTPGYMFSGGHCLSILQRENPSTILVVRSFLENNPWYETPGKHN
jgi:hypothetical protein